MLSNLLLLGYLIGCFMTLCSFNTLLTYKNSSKEISESLKALETDTSIVFNLILSSNFILFCLAFLSFS